MDSICVLLLILLGIGAAVSAVFLIIRYMRKPKMTELDYYYKHYNSRLIYGDGSGTLRTGAAEVVSLDRRLQYGQEVDYVVFSLSDGEIVTLAIRGDENFALFTPGMKGELVFKGNTFLSFTPAGDKEPLLIDGRYADHR